MIELVDMNKVILLSFDIEEFDIPEEYGQAIEDAVKFEVSFRGLKETVLLLERLNITATFFVTANFALNHKAIIKEIAKKHEVASHGYYHSDFSLKDLKKSQQVLSQLTGKRVVGFRMPRLKEVDDREIEQAGYEYNSSMNPTYLPGRYNNFFKSRTVYYSNKLLNIPVSVTPLIRFPLFWLSFKNLPLWLMKLASYLTITSDSYLNIYFHSWEFSDIKKFKLPSYIKNRSGNEMVDRLEQYLIWLKTQGEFICFSDFKQKVQQRSF